MCFIQSLLMTDDQLPYKGTDLDTLIDVAKRAIAILAGKDPADVKLDEDGDLVLLGGSAHIIISFVDAPSAFLFKTTLLDGVKESAALYALINEINVDIEIGQIFYSEKCSAIRYFYKYPAENPTPELVAAIVSSMIEAADLYDDRLKVRLGGERFNEQADDEIDI